MRTLQIEWDLSLAPELRAAMEPFVKRYLDVLPPWCQTLQIFADRDAAEKGESYMRMAGAYMYRKATLFVQPEFLDKSPAEREQTIVHEFVHVINAPLVEFTDQLIEIVEAKETGAKEMLDTLQESGMEAATEDMAALIWSLTKDRRMDARSDGSERPAGKVESTSVRPAVKTAPKVRAVRRGKRAGRKC